VNSASAGGPSQYRLFFHAHVPQPHHATASAADRQNERAIANVIGKLTHSAWISLGEHTLNLYRRILTRCAFWQYSGVAEGAALLYSHDQLRCNVTADTCGTVFKITPGGTFTTLHSFVYPTEGAIPLAGLIQATDGNFYGTTLGGGDARYGTVFQMTPRGALARLHSFDNTDGRNPNALIQDTSGTLYGTTARGASSIGKFHRCTGICGTVFSLSLDLSPFVEAQPGSGKVGAAVKILGTNLTDATSVTLSGAAASFTVVSSSEITTTVPAGATTGEVEVVTPSGTLSSDVSFRCHKPSEANGNAEKGGQ
jgi:uncharacterized repeat protein (TIGR03803 family)